MMKDVIMIKVMFLAPEVAVAPTTTVASVYSFDIRCAVATKQG